MVLGEWEFSRRKIDNGIGGIVMNSDRIYSREKLKLFRKYFDDLMLPAGFVYDSKPHTYVKVIPGQFALGLNLQFGSCSLLISAGAFLFTENTAGPTFLFDRKEGFPDLSYWFFSPQIWFREYTPQYWIRLQNIGFRHGIKLSGPALTREEVEDDLFKSRQVFEAWVFEPLNNIKNWHDLVSFHVSFDRVSEDCKAEDLPGVTREIACYSLLSQDYETCLAALDALQQLYLRHITWLSIGDDEIQSVVLRIDQAKKDIINGTYDYMIDNIQSSIQYWDTELKNKYPVFYGGSK